MAISSLSLVIDTISIALGIKRLAQTIPPSMATLAVLRSSTLIATYCDPSAALLTLSVPFFDKQTPADTHAAPLLKNKGLHA